MWQPRWQLFLLATWCCGNLVSGQPSVPEFTESFYSIDLPTFGEPDQSDIIQCSDPDGGSVTYALSNTSGVLTIDERTGLLTRIPMTSSVGAFFYTVTCTDDENMSVTVTLAVNYFVPNLNAPNFTMATYSFSVTENNPTITPVGTVTANDPDGDNVDYDLEGPSENSFRILSDGQIFSTRRFDREMQDTYTLNVLAYDVIDRLEDRRTSTATLSVRINDINDNRPAFVGPFPVVIINQNLVRGASVTTVTCVDMDIGELTYMLSSDGEGRFAINMMTGNITFVSGSLMQGASFLIVAACTDGTHETTQFLNITVEEENQNDPVLSHDTTLHVRVEETVPLQYVVADINATDADGGEPGRIIYRLMNDFGKFTIDETTGVIRVSSMLDFETQTSYVLVVSIENPQLPGSNLMRSIMGFVEVNVINVNDHPPEFEGNYMVSVNETFFNEETGLYNIPPPVNFVTLRCTDRDVGVTNITYSLGTIQDSSFAIDPILGNISAIRDLDFEEIPSFSLQAYCYDNGMSHNLTGTTLVEITILPINEHRPVIRGRGISVRLNETTPLHTIVLSFDPDSPGFLNYTATDADSGGDGMIFYFIGESSDVGLFEVDQDRGIYRIATSLDADNPNSTTITVATLQVVACDARSIRIDCNRILIRVVVLAINEHMPMFSEDGYTFLIPENTPPSTTTPVFNVVCSDQDIQHGITTITTRSGIINEFTINETGSFFLLQALDYETNIHYGFELECTDGTFTNATTVNITVLPVNDNVPRLIGDPFTFNVSVSTPVLSRIGRVTAADDDRGDGGQLEYILESNFYFNIDSDTGYVSLLTQLDNQNIMPPQMFLLQVNVTDGQTLLTTNVTILLTDGNYISPSFVTPTFINNVVELQEIGYVIEMLTCIDNDTGANGKIMYRISQGNNEGLFSIDTDSGVLTVAGTLVLPENERTVDHVLTIECRDGGVPILSSTTSLIVRVMPNDSPVNVTGDVVAFVLENADINHVVATINATDFDNNQLTYTISDDGNNNLRFAVTNTGQIIVRNLLDRENTPEYRFVVEVSDGSSRDPVEVNISIFVRDVNDNDPQCSFLSQILRVEEQTPVNTVLIPLNCSDIDSADNSRLSYMLEEDSFNISSTGQLILSESLNASYQSTYTLSINVSDNGVNVRRSVIITVIVLVLVSNTRPPQFQNFPTFIEINETTPQLDTIHNVEATDPEGSQVSYRLGEGNTDTFLIIPHSGDIILLSSLDFHITSTYVLTIIVSDGELENSMNLTINVIDVNEYSPSCSQQVYFIDINENAVINSTRSSMLSCTDSDRGPNGEVTYSILSSNIFGISSQGSLVILSDLDYETQQQYTLTITVSDGGVPPRTTFTMLMVSINPINEYDPVFNQSEYRMSILESLNIGSNVLQVFATDMDLSTHRDGEISYSISSNSEVPFSINNNGVIRLFDTLDRETDQSSTFAFVVFATDGGDTQRSGSATVIITVEDVNDNQPSFTRGLYTTSIPASIMTGAVVLSSLSCTDQDSDMNGRVSYSLENENFTQFMIDSSSGIITLRDQLPPLSQVFSFNVICADMGSPSLSSTVQVSILVTSDGNVTFSSPQYMVDVPEDATLTEIIVNVSASSPAGEVTYNLLTHMNLFNIDSISGAITLISSLDFEMDQSYVIEVQASVSGSSSQFANAIVQVNVININDEAPLFIQRMFSVDIMEGSTTFSGPVLLSCSDGDSGSFGQIQYTLDNNNNFARASNGQLQILNPLDSETITGEVLFLTATCSDLGTPPKNDSIIIVITVLPVNEYPPMFADTVDAISIDENIGIARAVYTAVATDRDSHPHPIYYSIVSGNDENYFSIDRGSGAVTVINEIDYEQISTNNVIILTIQADDEDPTTSLSLNSNLTLTITVRDVNDNEPRFTESVYFTPLEFPISRGTPLLTVTCTDADSGGNGAVTYSINPPHQSFQISEQGTITATEEINPMSPMTYSLMVQCNDQGMPMLMDTSRVLISGTIVGVGPMFNQTSYRFDLPENSRIGSEIGRVFAMNFDPQNQEPIHYSEDNNGTNFIIGENTGIITLVTRLDYEQEGTEREFTITIYATDSVGLNNSVPVVIILQNVNEVLPSIDASSYAVAISEHTPIGTTLSSLSCQDSDDAADGLMPTLTLLTNLTIDTPIGFTRGGSQNQGSLVTSAVLDYEERTQFLVTFHCTDSGGLTSMAEIRIAVEPFNDNPPRFDQSRYNTSLVENPRIGTTVTTITANDADLGNYNQIQYSIVGDNTGSPFSIDSSSGSIRVTGLIDHELQTNYNLVIQAVDVIPLGDTSGSQPLTSTTQLYIEIIDLNDNRPSLSPLSVIRTMRESVVVPPVVITTFQCSDIDSGMNGEVALQITSGDSSFYLSGNDLFFNGSVNVNITYTTSVTCSDMGTPQQSRTAPVTFIISSENQHAPMFVEGSVINITIPDDFPVGESFGIILATDADGNDTADGQITYQIMPPGSIIFIDPLTGRLFVASPIRISAQTVYDFTVQISDGGTPSLGNTATLYLTVTTGDNSPPQFTRAQYSTNIPETFRFDETFYTEIACIDADRFDSVTYFILPSGSHELFSLHPTTGHLSIATNVTLDFEETETHSLLVACRDTNNATASAEVTIILNPVNEFAPLLESITTTVPETAYVGFLVATFRAEDDDAGDDGEVRYMMTENDAFIIDSVSGRVVLSSSLDYESGTRNYNFTVVANDLSVSARRTATAQLLITVEDVNDNAPSFTNDIYEQTITASSPVNTVVLSVSCSDNDVGQSQRITYHITPNPPSTDIFDININNGNITVAEDLRERELDNATFFVTCRDNVHPVLSDTALIAIHISEVNQYTPAFTRMTYTMSIEETYQLLQPILTVSATDADIGPYGRITYTIQPPSDIFFINSTDGTLSLLKQLDYETQRNHTLTVVATDGAPDSLNRMSATANVEITVLNINEYTPRCPMPIYIGIIADMFSGRIINFNCVDRDDDLAGMLTYSITEGNTNDLFSIEDSSLNLTIPVDPMGAQERYSLNVTVSDMGNPPRQIVVNVEVLYSFENTQAPVFSSDSYDIFVPENQNIGEMVGRVNATDNDHGIQGEVVYSLTGPDSVLFRIDPINGMIYLASTLDREETELLVFDVIATDQDRDNPMSSSAQVNVSIVDINDNRPTCSQDFYQFEILSNLPENSPVGCIICSDADSGNNAALEYAITELADIFAITNDGQITLRSRGNLNSSSSALVEVSVSDQGDPSLSISVSVSIRVVFGNSEAPVFTGSMPYNATVDENAQLLTVIFQVNATDSDSSIGDLRYRSVDDDSDTFYVNSNTGEILLVRSVDYETRQSYSITVEVTDSGSYDGSNVLSSSTMVQIDVGNVNDNSPMFDSGAYGTIIPQSEPVSSRIINGSCTDSDDDTYGDVTVTWDGDQSPFALMPLDNGAFTIMVASQSITSGSYLYSVVCTDGGNVSSTTMVYISVRAPPDPQFTESRYEWFIRENANIGASFTIIMATSPDSNNPIVYSLVDDSEQFGITPSNGTVSLTQALDYESQTQFGLIVRATDTLNQFTDVLLLVRVLDVNDQLPLVPPSADLSINHNHPIDAPFAFLTCSDDDSTDENSRFNFTFDPPSEIFFVSDVGVVFLTRMLDLTPVYALPVVCFNVETPEVRSFGVVTITVIFNNLYQPVFEFQNYHASAAENAAIGDGVIQVSATDDDVGVFGELRYSIIEGDDNNHFFINSSSGEIKVLLNLDREQNSVFNLTVAAVDGGLTTSQSQRRTGTTLVQIFVSDYNDNPPMFDESLYYFNITTTTPRNSLIGNIMCSDLDEGRNMEISYSLRPEDTYYFSLNGSGAIFLLDQHSSPAPYTLTAVCSDNGTPQLSSTAILSIIVRLEDPEAPVFDQSTVDITVNEDIALFSLIASLSATSNDSTLEIRYNITSGNDDSKFQIDEVTGELYNVQLFDAELVDEYSIVVEARYTEYLIAVSYATVSVRVTDINDNTPYFVPSPLYSAMILEAVGMQEVLTVSCMDNDTVTNISYSIVTGNVEQIFAINSAGVIFSTDAFDYEQTSSYTLTISCSDGRSAPRSATAQAVVVIIPQNDHVPEFSTDRYEFVSAENVELGTSVGRVSASDGDSGPHGHITYRIVTAPPLDAFFIHPTSGMVVSSGTLDYESIAVYEMYAIATDGYTESTVPLVVTIQDVNDNDPAISPPVLIREIEHNTSANTVVGHFDCSDADTVHSQSLIINVTSGNERSWFLLETDGDVVWNGIEININSAVVSTLIIHCYDAGNRRSNPAQFTSVVYPAGQTIPQFVPSNIYIMSVNEHSPNDTVVITIMTDSSNAVQYSITDLTNDNLPFVIDSVTGVIRVSSDIDYATQQMYSFVVIANDTTNALSNAAAVSITINDINDHRPEFSMGIYSIPIPENLLVPAYVATFVCTDEDVNDNTEISIASGSNNLFSVSSDGVLSVISSLDFETASSHRLLLRCSDGTHDASSVANITVTPTNEHPPVFADLPYMVTVMESDQIQRNIFTVSATDADRVNGADITYRLITNTASTNFHINTISGMIQNRMPLLVVDQTHYALEVIALDGGSPNEFTSTAIVTVEVTDVNDRPSLVLDTTRVTASTASMGDSILLTFQCVDDDLNQNAELQLSHHSNPNPGVGLQTVSSVTGVAIGQLYVNTTLQYGNYTVEIICTDMGVSPMSTSATISIEVINANSEAPEFLNSSYVVSIYENVTINTLLITVLATDPNGVSYQIIDGNEEENFYIIPNNGSIFIQRAVDADFGATSYNLTIVASDLAPAQPLSATTIVNILVIGINDHDPEIDPSTSTVLTLPETTQINDPFKQYTCIDIDGSTTRLSVAPNGNVNSTFQIIEDDDGNSYVALRRLLDYEFVPSYTLTILCSDEATAILPSRTSSALLTIDVQAVNIFSPVFTNASYNFSIAERSPSGTFVGVVSAADADNRAMSAVRYTIVNSSDLNAFFIGSLSGEIRTTNNLNADIFMYNIIVQASDEDPLVPALSSTALVTITVFDVNDNRPVCPDQVIELSRNQTVFPANTSVVNITCSDEDSGINSLLTYSFNSVPSNGFSIQTINDTVGEIRVSGTIIPSIYVLVVNVSDRGPVPLSEVIHVVINIQRAPDDRLRFSNAFFAVNVSENTPLSTVIFRGSNFENSLVNVDGTLQYSTIVDDAAVFLINGITGDVSVFQSLDYESPIDFYTVIIDVEDDSGTHALGSLTVFVTNFNDERPVFSQPEYRPNITENEDAGTEVIQIAATDVDFSPVTYHLATDTNAFAINSTTGILTTLRPLDREREPFSLFLQVNATDSGDPQLFSIVNVYITIIDLNDNPPGFNQTQYLVNITNVSPAGHLITLSAYDPDSSSRLTYSIDDSSGLFSIDPVSGSLQLQATVPPSHQEFYSFTAFVSDGINTQNASILVQVFDVTLVLLNFEETEIIGKAEFNITTYLIVIGTDIIPDESTYEIISGNTNMNFNISQGNITNVKPLDRELIDRYEIILAVNGTMSNEQINVFLLIDIHDVNDNAPIFSESAYMFSITESHYVSPFEIGQIQATDQDAGINSRISFEIVDSEMLGLPFLLQSTTGGNVRFTVIGGIDREVQSLYNLTILARDFAPVNTMTSTAIAIITVIDDNDNSPIFDQSYENPITAVLDTPAGTRLSTLTATDMDVGSNGEITFTMNAMKDNVNVTVDYHLEYITNRNGVVNLITRKTIGLDSDDTMFNITARDNGMPNRYGDTITLILRVGNSNPEFTSPVYTGQVLEDSSARDSEIVLQVLATDKDYGNSGLVRYRFFEETGGIELEMFTIDSLRGTINIHPDNVIFALPSTRYGFFVEAIDGAPQPGSDTAFVIIDVFGNINVLNILTCQTYESLMNTSNREQFRQSVETLIKQQAGGSLFINRVFNTEDENKQVVTVVSIYMIVQNNFYQNWTSDIYTSEIAARSSPKSFYKADDVRMFLNMSLENPNNKELMEELCILSMETLSDDIQQTTVSTGTEWPESPTGIAVITVGAFLLVALVFCLTCCICVCCLREEKEKDPFVHVAKRVDDNNLYAAAYPQYGNGTVWPGYGYPMDDGEEFAHDDPESRMLYEHQGENEMMTTFMNDQESDFNDEHSGIHPSETDMSVVASENESTRLKWNMGPYLKEVLEKFEEGENILSKQEHKKRQKKSKH